MPKIRTAKPGKEGNGRQKKKRRSTRCDVSTCGKTIRYDRQKSHKAKHDHNKKATFKCSECEKGFDERRYLKYHQKVHTNPVCCPVLDCTKQFARHSQMESHYSRIHKNTKKKNDDKISGTGKCKSIPEKHRMYVIY